MTTFPWVIAKFKQSLNKSRETGIKCVIEYYNNSHNMITINHNTVDFKKRLR